jgi:23S rRNA G2445 N2-methylase RlmL
MSVIKIRARRECGNGAGTTMTEAAISTHRGMEDVCLAECKALLGVRGTKGDGVVFVDAPLKRLCEFCYRCRSATRVIAVLDKEKLGVGKATGADPLEVATQLAQRAPLGDWFKGNPTFACRAHHLEDSMEVAAEAGGIINDRTNAKVDLDNPQLTTIVILFGDTLVLGIDLGGELVGRREYRIFLGSDSLQGTLAFGLLGIAGYDASQSLCDIFCRSGIICIEAAMQAADIAPCKHQRDLAFRDIPLLADEDWNAILDGIDKEEHEPKKSVIAMDETFGAVAAAKKNAKIAGVVKFMDFSRTDLEFLDAKFGKGGIDMICTMPPQPSATLSGNKLDAILKQLFYQAEFILKKGGTLGIITKAKQDLLKQYAAEFKFSLKHERDVFQGKLKMSVLVFSK